MATGDDRPRGRPRTAEEIMRDRLQLGAVQEERRRRNEALVLRAVAGEWPWREHLRGLILARGYPNAHQFTLALRARTESPPAYNVVKRILSGERRPRPDQLRKILEFLGATHADILLARPAKPGPKGFQPGADNPRYNSNKHKD